MGGDNFLPLTRRLVDKIIGFLKQRPRLYNMVLGMAQRHDRWMDYRKYGKTAAVAVGTRVSADCRRSVAR